MNENRSISKPRSECTLLELFLRDLVYGEPEFRELVSVLDVAIANARPGDAAIFEAFKAALDRINDFREWQDLMLDRQEESRLKIREKNAVIKKLKTKITELKDAIKDVQ